MSDPLRFSLVVVSRLGQRRNITSVADALDLLLRDWPLKSRGMAYRAARRSCLAAVEGEATAESARMAFIRAAMEADIIVKTVEMRPGEEIVDAKPFALVVIETATGRFRSINSVRDAAEALAGDWPTKRRFRPARRAATRACQDALAGRMTPEAARQAFIDAAQEAGIFVRAG